MTLEARLMKHVDDLQADNTRLVTENRALKAELAARRSEMREPWPHDRRGDVTAFFRVAGQAHDIGARPHVPPERSLRLGLQIFFEEVSETLLAAFDDSDGDALTLALARVARCVDVLPLAPDLPALADGIIDTFYTGEGLLIRCGINGRPIWDAVHRCNLTKAGGPIDPTTGKLMKKADFVPPDIEGELRQQGWQP